LGKSTGNQKTKICFDYQANLYQGGPIEFFASYPVLKFRLKDESGQLFELKWYPSEYLVKHGDHQYCFAAEV
jgi:hypothetical protein